MKMPFGKYKGWEVREVPIEYLRWAYANIQSLNAGLKYEIWGAINQQGWEEQPADDVADLEGMRELIVEAVSRLRRKLAGRFHPDRGGDSETMKFVNDAFDRLEAEIDNAIGEH